MLRKTSKRYYLHVTTVLVVAENDSHLCSETFNLSILVLVFIRVVV